MNGHVELHCARPDARDWYSLPYFPTDYAAEIQQKHNGILYSFATILPCGGSAQSDAIELIVAADQVLQLRRAIHARQPLQ